MRAEICRLAGFAAYAEWPMRFFPQGLMLETMQHDLASLSNTIESIAELRALYRAAEARAARLRLLSNCARELGEAGAADLDVVLDQSVTRLALFLGARSGRLEHDPRAKGLAVGAPGGDGETVARVVIEGVGALEEIGDEEDREACRMLLAMLGTTIDRAAREARMALLLDRLQEREHSLAQLVGRIFTVQEDERRRVAYDLHDGVAQTATALVRLLEGTGTAGASDPDCEERARLAAIARGLVQELRGVIAGLRPTILDDFGLVAALRALCDEMEREGYAVTLHIEHGADRLPTHVETAFYRVAQEAFANIRKHAGELCGVQVVAQLRAGEAPLVLRIADEGSGPRDVQAPAECAQQGYRVGIESMKERMSLIGGGLDWRGAPGSGVVVEAILPQGAV